MLFERTIFGWVLAGDSKKLMAQIAQMVVVFATSAAAVPV